MKMKKNILILLIFAIFICCKHPVYRQDSGMVWHTTYHITYESDKQLSDSILSVFNEVSRSLNVFDNSSLVSRVNMADSVKVDSHFSSVYAMATKINGLSDGAFDPTLGPLIDAWGFGRGHSATSDTLRIDSILKYTGIGKTKIENGCLIKNDKRISFNFSAIAKGYGCDMVAAMFERNGVQNYLVEVGGEIRCKGKNPKGQKWKISIDKPIRTDTINHDSQCIVELTSGGLATSGNYRNYTPGSTPGTGHTISSRSGRPVETDILSATVIAQSAMEADALATSMIALGSEKAQALSRRLGYPVLLVLSDMSVWQQFISPEAGEP